MQQRLDENPQAMRVRRETVEHPFGTLKMRMGATHFLMKRLPKVATEMALHVLAYNLTRVMNIVGVEAAWRRSRREASGATRSLRAARQTTRSIRLKLSLYRPLPEWSSRLVSPAEPFSHDQTRSCAPAFRRPGRARAAGQSASTRLAAGRQKRGVKLGG